MFGLISAYFFNNLFVFDQISSYILFFTVLAYMHSHAPEIQMSVWDKISARISKMFESEKSKPIAEALILIVTIAVVYFVIYLPWRQNVDLLAVLRLESSGKIGTISDYAGPLSNYGMGFSESLEHISQTAINLEVNPNASAELKQQLFDAVDKAFVKQLTITPNDARYRLFYGMFLSRFGLYDRAVEQLTDAQKLSPNKQQMYFELVNNYLLAGKVTEAVQNAKTAFDLEPSYTEARFIYGLALLSSGNKTLSDQILSGVPESTIIFDDRYLSVLLTLKQYNQIIAVVKRRIELDRGTFST